MTDEPCEDEGCPHYGTPHVHPAQPRCDVCFGPMPCDGRDHHPYIEPGVANPAAPPEGMIPNPLLLAARLMRDIHGETLRLVNGGFTYTRDGEDVSLTMKAACEAEIARIDAMLAVEPEFVSKAHVAVALYERFIDGVERASQEAAVAGKLS